MEVTGELDKATYDLLMSENAQAAPTPEPTAEPTPEPTEAPAFLQKEIVQLGDFSVKTWMAMVVVIVLIGIIVLLLILMKPSSKKKGSASAPVAANVHNESEVTVYENNQNGSETTVYDPAQGEGQTTVYENGAFNGFAGAEVDVNEATVGGVNVQFTIVASNGSARNETGMVTSAEFVIGRAAQANLVLVGDQSVSKRHAVLSFDGAAMHLKDESSHHSTLVNNMPITSPEGVVIESGTTLTLGETFVTLNW